MSYRCFGWIQNPNNFGKLKKVVQIFSPDSKYYNELISVHGLDKIFYDNRRKYLRNLLINNRSHITFSDLKGKVEYAPNKKHSRANQIANGLVQLAAGFPSEIETSVEKTWTDDYTAGSFVNWALTFNFLKVNDKDELSITNLGKNFAKSKNGFWKSSKNYVSSDEEINILRDAVMSYPPAIRILSLLEKNKNKNLLSKFQLGEELGFSGEPGFTSFNENEWFEYFKTLNKSEQKKFRSNGEGSADKWARGIASWLEKLDLIEHSKKKNDNGEYITTGYKIKLSGEILLKKARGNSSNPVKRKYVDWTMFATKVTNANYVRKRRAFTLKAIQNTSSIPQISEILKEQKVFDGLGVLKSDVVGLIRFGLNIQLSNGKYIWKDSTNDFYIPERLNTVELDDSDLKELKDYLQNELTYIDPRDIEIIEMAWKKSPTKSQNTIDAALFESRVVDIMKKYIHLSGKHLGGPNKPDGFLYYKNLYGIILDTKEYSQGYNLPIDQQREMQDYIYAAINKIDGVPQNEWWKIIPADITNKLNFIWVAGDFSGNYLDGIEQTHLKTQINGGALDIVTLLKLSNQVYSGDLSPSDVPGLMQNGRIELV